MGMEEEALAFAKRLEELYLGQRNMPTLLKQMDQRVSWIGTGAGELSRNITEAGAALARELEEYSGGFEVMGTDLQAVPLSETCCVVYGSLQAKPLMGDLEEEHLRLSLVCERGEGGLRLVHCHCSRPDGLLKEGHSYVHQSDRAEHSALENALRSRTMQLENLTQNIPGGVFRCRNDSGFTIQDVSDGFLALFGYSREELRRLYGDRYMNMIYPGDRAEVLRSVGQQVSLGSDMELEYRVICKDGRVMWILNKGRLLDCGPEGHSFYNVLVDTSDRKRSQEELRLSLERHQVIMDQTTDIIFEWDILKDTLIFSSNWRKKFGYEAIGQEIGTRIPMSENIHPDDIPTFRCIMRDTAEGVPYSEAEFRIKNITGRYLWCRVRATAQFDSDGHAIKAVGVIIDIDAAKRQTQALLDRAQRDALTGLYNKAAINSLVEQRMREGSTEGLQALMMIDVDNFKQVNDTYGHLSGDSLLSDVAAVLRTGIRASDLVGRIGGDEFLVFLPEVKDESAAWVKAEGLLSALRTLKPGWGGTAVTCSIGLAVCRRGEMDYFSLYRCADDALYHRKRGGRNGVSIFDPKGTCSLNGTCSTAVGSIMGGDEGSSIEESLPLYAFRTLYQAPDVTAALNTLLEILGRSYDVSRAYIFETTEDGERTSITFEWCSDDVRPQMQDLQNLRYQEDLGDYTQNFNAEGVFYCRDIREVPPELYEILAPQGIRSMLQCAILENGKFLGGVGFDECRENRNWSERQTASFQQTAQVLAAFLTKFRLHQRLERLGGGQTPSP